MTNPTLTEAASGSTDVPALIVLGRDDTGKPHASWFGEEDAPLAQEAAGLMGMSALQIQHDAVRTLAAGLPKGRVFASGKAFVPFVKADVFESLAVHLPAHGPGNAADTVEQQQEASPGMEGASSPDDKPAHSPSTEPTPPPADHWSLIRMGKLVLASEGKGEPWYEAVVIQDKGEHLTLRWRDYPDEPHIVRRREQVALLHPTMAASSER